MRRTAALFGTVLLMLVLAMPARATMVMQEEPEEIPAFSYLPITPEEDVTQVPPGLTAEDIYSGPIDSFTGVPLGATEGDIGGNRIVINDYTGYDRDRHLFFSRTSSQEILSNVADGMVTTESVSLIIPDAFLCRLYCDGQPVDDVDYLNISTPGAYVLQENSISQQEILRFTIVNHATGKISRLEMPEGFVIKSCLCDGAPQEFASSYADMAKEGEYLISYYCPVTEGRFNLNIVIDHTPPTLALEAVNEKGQAHGPVDISDLEPEAKIGILFDNQQIDYSQELTRPGSYYIVLEDEAGNRNTYQFIIRIYFNLGSMIFVVIIMTVAIGVGVYVLYSRKHVRVR